MPRRCIAIGDPSPTGPTVRYSFPPEASTPGRARHRLDAVLDEWGVAPDDRWSAVLVVSESVTNAVEHARTPLLLAMTLIDGGVLIEVHDGSAARPTLRALDITTRRGHGLRVVQDLACDWSWTLSAGGKTVWARVPTTDAAP